MVGCRGFIDPILALSKDHHTGNRLHQEPTQELEQLRTEPSAHLPSLRVPAGQGVPLPEVTGPSLEVSLRLERGQSLQAGLLLRPWLRADSAGAEPTAAALVVDWESQSLEVRTYANSSTSWTMVYSMSQHPSRHVPGLRLSCTPGAALSAHALRGHTGCKTRLR